MTRNALYRDTARGKIGGVCAGFAEHFGIETWVVRVFAVGAFFIGFGVFTVIAYIAAMLLIDKKPENVNPNRNLNNNTWQLDSTPSDALNLIELQFKAIEQNVRTLERYVTKPEFDLNREFRKL